MNALVAWVTGLFKTPSAAVLAEREYEEACRSLLRCQSMSEYYDNMVNFETRRVERLRQMLHKE